MYNICMYLRSNIYCTYILIYYQLKPNATLRMVRRQLIVNIKVFLNDFTLIFETPTKTFSSLMVTIDLTKFNIYPEFKGSVRPFTYEEGEILFVLFKH